MMVKGATNQIRVRIAPSPTGFMHIGTARTALFNWLFAKKNGGTFVLRIEDTDTERSTKEYEASILHGLHWLGINWDEGPDPKGGKDIGAFGPYRQSERGDIYSKYVKKLLEEKKAYYCFCTEEELEAERQAMLTAGQAPKYAGTCRNLPIETIEKKLGSGVSSVIRFRMPEGKITVTDIIRGKTVFDLSLTGDIAIAKSPRAPFYNFAVVIDDYEMKISHVIRGEDHFANTPKQLAIGEALGFPEPKFAHIPLILNSDRSKMSKRHGDTSVDEYRKAGYLPHALFNFLAFLGWHPLPEVDKESGKVIEREMLTPEELVERFEIERVQKGGAIFNDEKLEWLNAQYLKKMKPEEIIEAAEKIDAIPKSADKEKLLPAITLVRERIKKLTDISELTGFLFEISEYAPETLLWKQTPAKTILENLSALRKAIEAVNQDTFDEKSLEACVSAVSAERGRGEVFWPLRVALSGKEASPGPVEMMVILGKSETLARIASAIEKLHKLA